MGRDPDADHVVREFWRLMQARDWEALRALLHPRVVLEWPASGERFDGADAVVGVNREYPEGWSIDVVRVLAGADGASAVSEVEVPHGEAGVFAVTSWWQVDRGRIVAGREYWVQCGGDPPPPWRSRFATAWSGRPTEGALP
ncbi:MAG TPA: nuclear transport factor 2 family protein [Kineosporiaceae bacterium]|jgi:ketosteroid isomerase-like protein|nr:nuclear transport factor 2 family protein [Kineosporiaceae bacterium]